MNAAARSSRWLVPLTLLLALAAAGVCWLGYQLNWIGERHQLLESRTVLSGLSYVETQAPTDAPGVLRLFGEPGHNILFYLPDDADDYSIAVFDALRQDGPLERKPQKPLSEAELKRVEAIFPEARLSPFGKRK